MAMLYTVATLSLMLAFASLGVDLARVQLAKTELRTVADACARAAMGGLATGTDRAQSNAVSLAASNTVDGVPVSLDPNDVEFGAWNSLTHTFTVLSGTARSGANAIRVSVSRTSAKGNPIPLSFASVIGFKSFDLSASAIAGNKPTGYGVIGLDYINMGGNATDSYWSANGYTVGNYGAIGSNGDITLTGSSAVHGDANPGINHAVYGTSHVSGGTASVTTPFVFANGSAGGYATSNDDGQIPASAMDGTAFNPPANRQYTLPGGNYYFSSFYMSNNNSITFTGKATIYCYGDFTLWGGADTAQNLPGNLSLGMIPDPATGVAGAMKLGSNTDLYANIYAPQSPITISGNGDIYGSVLGKSVDMTGNAAIHYDLDSAGGSIGIALMK